MHRRGVPPLDGPRAIDALRSVLAVAIAVGAAHAMRLEDSWWAAITAFMVLQAGFGASLYRGTLRIVGTLLGAGAGFVLGPVLAPSPVAFVILMAFAAWGGLFAALVFRHGYAWVLAIVTFVMVMCEALGMRGALGAFTVARIANIVVGVAASMIVAALTHRRLSTATEAGSAQDPPVDRQAAARHALDGAIAVALLAVIISVWRLTYFPQGMVTAIAVLIVPLGGSAADPHTSVMQRMAQRFAGCLLAGLAALALLPWLGGKTLLCQLALCLGVWVGAYLQGGPPRLRYLAVQFSVAFLMVFVQDRGWTVEALPAMERLGGVLAGIAVLAVVFLISSVPRARTPRVP